MFKSNFVSVNFVEENVSLRAHNTFGISATARYYAKITNKDELQQLANSALWQKEKLILGGGSNLLLLDDFDGLVVHIATKGIKVREETADEVVVQVEAGENWHQFVMYALSQGWFGIENLSLIPGSVGASPMQNIGAYGVEIEQVFDELEAFHIEEHKFHRFSNEACAFGYRTSVFKTSQKGKFIITQVTFRLSKQAAVNVSYGAISKTLAEKGVSSPTPHDVSEAVIEIRQGKLPDPAQLGNAGSFFKNPVVQQDLFEQISENHPNMPHYPVDENFVKIPAGWLIDQCGFKGTTVGNTGTYAHQALILVNHGEATGEEIWNFAMQIQQTVKQQFGIELEPEVNLVQ